MTDVFCYLCGNPSHNYDMPLDEIKEHIDSYYQVINRKKTRSWFLNYMKPIVDAYEKDQKLFMNNVKELYKITKWMKKCTFLTVGNKVIHNCQGYGIDGFDDSKGNSYFIIDICDDTESNGGVFIHTDCWKFIKKTYNIELKYSHLPPFDHNIDYGKIKQYWDQNFKFLHVIADSNQELLYSPLVSIKTNHLKKIFSQFEIRNDKNRKSPPNSATLYKVGTYKIGNNNGIWKIKGNKWIDLTADTIQVKIKIDNKNKLLQKLVHIATYNILPLFIKSMNISSKKNIEIDLITTNEYYEKNLEKYVL